MKGRIEIEAFNPYENRFPNRKLITLESLILIKYLRSEGYEICVLPNNKVSIEYLFKKGVRDFLSDPLNIVLIQIPIGIATSLMANYIQELIAKKLNYKAGSRIKINSENITLIHSNHFFDIHGIKITKNIYNSKINNHKKKAEKFNKFISLNSPFFEYPAPIFLEHEPVIVGWCTLYVDETGLRTEGVITNEIIKRRVSQGRYKGASVTGIAKVTECSICKENFINCNHIAGQIYNDKECTNKILEADFIEMSLVKEPINQNCVIGLK